MIELQEHRQSQPVDHFLVVQPDKSRLVQHRIQQRAKHDLERKADRSLLRFAAAAPQVAESGPGAAGVSVVERMLIRSAVEELIADYTYCHDRQDAPCVEALMTEDIRITDHMGKSFVGRAEAMRRFNARPAGRLTRHAITNFHIGVTDRDHANATRLMVYFAADENKPRSATPQAVSEYQESYVREPDGRWRISSRVVSNVFDQTGK